MAMQANANEHMQIVVLCSLLGQRLLVYLFVCDSYECASNIGCICVRVVLNVHGAGLLCMHLDLITCVVWSLFLRHVYDDHVIHLICAMHR